MWYVLLYVNVTFLLNACARKKFKEYNFGEDYVIQNFIIIVIRYTE